jgi:hypothetical protein
MLTIQSIMKTSHKTKNSFSQTEARTLTFGDLVAATYDACGQQQAPKILQMALESHLIRFSRPPCMSW